jgi:transposase
VASINRVWRKLLGVERMVIEGWELDEAEEALVFSVRAMGRGRRRCSQCGQRCPGYDQGAGRRRWRGLDLGTVQVFLEAEAPRVSCPEHGVVVAEVPWARAGSGFTREFEDQCGWLAVHTSRTAVSALMRVAWRTVGRIVERLTDEGLAGTDLLAGLKRIGIDELSYRKGQKYLTVVVDHDSGRLVWMQPGRDAATVHRFFDALDPERSAALELVSADGALWIEEAVAKRAPQAVRCLDPFHVVQWATDALDEVRRALWNELRRGGEPEQARDLKGARWALWKNPENLNARQRRTLAWLSRTNAPLYRAYLLKESLRTVFRQRTLPQALEQLDAWIAWACRSRLEPFVKLSRSIRNYRERIEATLKHGLTNALVEGRNTQLRLLHRIAHGFHDVNAFIGLAMLKLAGLCPPLPGRI